MKKYRDELHLVPKELHSLEEKRDFYVDVVQRIVRKYEDHMRRGSAVVANSFVEQLNALKRNLNTRISTCTTVLGTDDATFQRLINETREFRVDEVNNLTDLTFKDDV